MIYKQRDNGLFNDAELFCFFPILMVRKGKTKFVTPFKWYTTREL